MAGAFDQVAGGHAAAGPALHGFEIPRLLVGAPVAFSGDEHGRHVDAAPREHLQFGVEVAHGAAAIPLQAALESGARIFAAVDLQLGIGQPCAGRDRRGRRHVARDGLGHVVRKIHHVIGRQPRHLVGRQAGQRMRVILRPVGAFHVVISAQEGVQALRGVHHVGIGFAGRVVPLVVLARARQRRERGQHRAEARCGRWWSRRGGGEGQCRWSGERRTHQHHRAEHVGAQQCAPRGHRGAEIMADHVDRAITQCRHQPERIAHQVEHAERRKVAVVAVVPAGGAAVTTLVGRDHVVAGCGQGRHHLAPAVGQFGEAMQQQHAGPVRGFEAGLQQVHGQAVDAFDHARADAGRKRHVAVGGGGGHAGP